MKVLLRVDSSIRIGTGHIMRCLTLAHALAKKGVEIVFICRDLEGNLIEKVKTSGFKVRVLARPALTNRKVKKTAGVEKYLEWLEVEQEIDASQTADIISIEKPDWVVIDHYGIDEK